MEKLWLKSFLIINFRQLLEDKVLKSFLKLLHSFSLEDFQNILFNYRDFVVELREEDFSLYIKRKLNNAKKNNQTKKEIQIINEFIDLDYSKIKKFLCDKFPNYKDIIKDLPEFLNSKTLILYDDIKELQKIRTFIFEDNSIRPIVYEENLKFSDLKGYKKEKEILFENTKALLENHHASNVLLYGDAGCGKSSTVRALLGELEDLNLVQIYKKDLTKLDKLFEILKLKNEKFIIFMDDISFDENDADYSALKAVVEGSIIQCPNNAVIYATSNRRHMVKESFKARVGDEIHLNDTINEMTSLSDRFGICLLFQKPTNEQYIDIVLKLANDYGLDMDKNELIKLAQRYSISKGTRSPRLARQLVESLVIKEKI